MPIHDRCCAGLCAAAYREGAVLCAGGRLYDTLALVEWHRLWLDVSGFGRGIHEIILLFVGLMLWCWCLYYLFTIGKYIVSVCADSVLVCVRGYCFCVLRCFFLRVYVCMCVRVYMRGRACVLCVCASVYVYRCVFMSV